MTVVLLTGASRGIGASIVDVLLSAPNTKLVAISRSSEQLAAFQEQYGDSRFQYVSGDVTDSEVNIKAVELAVNKFGALDSVILNAGALEPVESISEVKVADWKKLFDVNFFSVIELTQLCLPHLQKSGTGNVIMVSSGSATSATEGWAPYGSSKAALNHFCLSLAKEQPHLRAVSIAPGVVDTQMQKDIREKFGTKMSKEGLQRFIDLKQNDELLDPVVPATIYANLAIQGIPSEINGQYLRYNDQRLATYGV